MEPAPHGALGKYCIICLDAQRSVRLACGHSTTCRECFDRLLQSQRARCPACRFEFDGLGTRAIYMESANCAREDTFIQLPNPPPPPPPPNPQPPPPPEVPEVAAIIASLTAMGFAGYQPDGVVGRGGFAGVHLARRPAGAMGAPLIAVKVQRSAEAHAKEVRALTRLACINVDHDGHNNGNPNADPIHPNVVALLGRTEAPPMYLIALEALHGDLFDYLIGAGALTNSNAWINIFRPIVHGLAHCHALGVAHLDLKLENVLLTAEGTPKLTDFGVSYTRPLRLADGSYDLLTPVALGVIGSAAYTAPEVYAVAPGGAYNPFVADMWSLGVLAFSLALGFFPLDTSTPDDWRFRRLASAQQQGRRTVSIVLQWYNRPSPITAAMEDILHRLLRVQPAERPTSAALGMAMAEANVDAAATHLAAAPDALMVPPPLAVAPPLPAVVLDGAPPGEVLPPPPPPPEVPVAEAAANLHDLEQADAAMLDAGDDDDDEADGPVYRSLSVPLHVHALPAAGSSASAAVDIAGVAKSSSGPALAGLRLGAVQLPYLRRQDNMAAGPS